MFYISPSHELVAVEVTTADGFKVGNRRTLFSVSGYRRHFTHRAYDVLPDGKHFVMIKQGPPLTGELALVDNWFSDLAARLPK